jgi:hypothetical protein
LQELCIRVERLSRAKAGHHLQRDWTPSSKWVDYCNNPADAWPIIDDSNIALIPSGGFGWVAVSNLTLNGESSYIDERLDDCFQCEDWRLRAAMIVFLMMQENQNG